MLNIIHLRNLSMIISDDVEIDPDDYLGKGNFGPTLTIRGGFAIKLRHSTHLLLGLSFVPTIGVHIGFTI